mmetsp:Transcript_10228/g.25942  ORF Transcript_10228/g.25942 Transcript_10228/m.25942 type:complete len:395 (-) Transcript_10228:211-1395(-)
MVVSPIPPAPVPVPVPVAAAGVVAVVAPVARRASPLPLPVPVPVPVVAPVRVVVPVLRCHLLRHGLRSTLGSDFAIHLRERLRIRAADGDAQLGAAVVPLDQVLAVVADDAAEALVVAGRPERDVCQLDGQGDDVLEDGGQVAGESLLVSASFEVQVGVAHALELGLEDPVLRLQARPIRRPPRQGARAHLHQDIEEAPQVVPWTQLKASVRVDAGICRGSPEVVWLGLALDGIAADLLADAEVDETNFGGVLLRVRLEQHIGRLDVPVDVPPAMHLGEPVDGAEGDGTGQARVDAVRHGRPGRRVARVAHAVVVEVAPAVFHDEERVRLVLVLEMQAGDRRAILEGLEHARLLVQTASAGRLLNLQGDLLPARVLALVHQGELTLAQLARNLE